MKKVISVILATLIFFSCFGVSGYSFDFDDLSAIMNIPEIDSEYDEEPVYPSDDDPYVPPVINENPFSTESSEETSSSSSAGNVKMYLCFNWSKFPSLGHVWIYFYNNTDHTINVGACPCPSGCGVSVGCFGLTRSDGFGVYYNIESYCSRHCENGLNDFNYLEKTISESRMQTVSAFMSFFNWWDPIIFNCAFFAIMAWNIGGGSFVFPIVIFPVIAKLQMVLHIGEFKSGTGNIMTEPPLGRSGVYKQHGFGSFATLETVVDGSVDTVPG